MSKCGRIRDYWKSSSNHLPGRKIRKAFEIRCRKVSFVEEKHLAKTRRRERIISPSVRLCPSVIKVYR